MLELITGFALGCGCVLAFAIVKDHIKLPAGRALLALMVAAFGFLLHPFMPSELRWLTADLQTFIPALFWLLCLYAFASRPNIRSYWTLIALYSALMPAFNKILPNHIAALNEIQWVMVGLSGYFEYLLIAAGIFIVVNHWADDLVESRRRLRLVVISVAGVSVLVNVISINFGIGNPLFQRATVALALFILGVNLLKINKGTLFGASTTTVAVPNAQKRKTEPKLQNHLTQLNTLMQNGFYKNENLTLAKLATELGIPEYLTRTLINEHLGYRNFNDYLNEWRIDDAKLQLQENKVKPISNIALDLGYRTLSSFNRAFKDRTELTPTQFRGK